MAGNPRPLGGWPVGLLCMALAACGDPSPVPAGAVHGGSDTPGMPVAAPAPPHPPALATLVSHADGVLRVQLDALAYAPLVQATLNAGDENAWRQALPSPRFTLRSAIEPDGVCDGGDRVVRFEDEGVRNTIELRACQDGASSPFLAGFSLQDPVVALERGLAPGATRASALAALGMATTAGRIDTIEIVNEEQNTTLRLHFDDDGRLRQVDYDPYTG